MDPSIVSSFDLTDRVAVVTGAGGGIGREAAIVFAGSAVGLAVQGFAAINVALTCVWLFVAWHIRREHRKLVV